MPTELWDIHSPDSLWELLAIFTSMALGTVSESVDLALPHLAWSSRFLQPERHFLNHLVTVPWSTAPSPFEQQMLVASTALSTSFQIRLCCTFICAAFKSHMEWSNSQRVSAPTATILPTAVGIYHNFNYFGNVIIHSKLEHITKILQNFWLALIKSM